MSAQARRNGWAGFDNAGERVIGGWQYTCDGMPSMMGCGGTVTVTRRWTRAGVKTSGWLVCFGLDDPGAPGDDGKGHDLDVVLTFCPTCAAVVKAQDASVSPRH